MCSILLFSIAAIAQEATYSPYSLHGIGLTKFRGTINNISMGGLTIVSDPVSSNVLNAATYADLKRVNFSVGGSYSVGEIQFGESQSDGSATSLDYLSLSIPANKFGFGFGLLPLTASGYRITQAVQEDILTQTAEGGVNRVYFGAGAQIYKGLKLGAEIRYNFGRLENEVTSTLLSTRISNQSDISGVSYAFSAIYDTNFSENYSLRYSVNYEFSGTTRSQNNQVSTGTVTTSSGLVAGAGPIQRGNVSNRRFNLPSLFTMGIAFSKQSKWLVASELSVGDASGFQDRFLTRDDVVFIDPFAVRFGGYYQPNYQSLNNYLLRIIYRAGIRYEKTGLEFRGQDVNEFGMSFGVSLPMRRGFSTIDLGFEAGTRGTTDSGAVKENFLNFSLGLNLTDKWFNKRKYD